MAKKVLMLLKEIAGIDVLIASALSFAASVVVNYLLSMLFVFKGGTDNKIKEFVIFVVLSVMFFSNYSLKKGCLYVSFGIFFSKTKVNSFASSFFTKVLVFNSSWCVSK